MCSLIWCMPTTGSMTLSPGKHRTKRYFQSDEASDPRPANCPLFPADRIPEASLGDARTSSSRGIFALVAPSVGFTIVRSPAILTLPGPYPYRLNRLSHVQAVSRQEGLFGPSAGHRSARSDYWYAALRLPNCDCPKLTFY